MSRRLRLTIWIGCGVSAVLIAGLVGVFFALRYEPKFYRDALSVASEAREEGSDQMLQRMAALVSGVRKPGKWQARFTAEQINGWLAVDFVKNHHGALPPLFHDPRVSIGPDGIVLACRYDGGIVSTVLTLTVEPYVPEENVLALRIIRVRAGLVPMSLEKVLDGITDAARRSEWRIEWRQTAGDPVALLWAPPPDDAGDLAVKIETIRLGKGDIFVSGFTERKK
ncbi:MAG: hypothetical protein ABSA26_05620 [Thermoguttaceae bacterium]|jgi:cytochrome c-type biogenesis protein CcmE